MNSLIEQLQEVDRYDLKNRWRVQDSCIKFVTDITQPLSDRSKMYLHLDSLGVWVSGLSNEDNNRVYVALDRIRDCPEKALETLYLALENGERLLKEMC